MTLSGHGNRKYVETATAPRLRNGLVERPSLVGRLAASASVPVVLVCAPAGYGKTTLLAQWMRRDPRPFAWVTLDDRDNDPEVFVERIIGAVERIEPLPPSVGVGIAEGAPIGSVVVPVLARALASRSEPLVLVVDNAGMANTPAAQHVLRSLIDSLRPGSQIVLSTRREPPVGVPRLRAAGMITELGPGDLAFSTEDGVAALEAAGLDIDRDEAVRLVERTEGWPAGLYLAALSSRTDQGRRAIGGWRADGRTVTDYLRETVLRSLPQDTVTFLLRSSVLERLTTSACDAVLQRTDSARALADLVRANLFVIPLDDHQHAYRYHHVFADMLRGELRRQDPVQFQALNSRASRWFESHNDPAASMSHAVAAGDPRRSAELLWSHIGQLMSSQGPDAVERFIEDTRRIGGTDTAADVLLDLSLAWVRFEMGDGDGMRRCRAAATRGTIEGRLPGGPANLEAALALLRAASCRHGLAQMASNAEHAFALDDARSRWRGAARLFSGAARQLAGDHDGAVDHLADAEERTAGVLPSLHVLALSQLAQVAVEDDRWAEASAHTEEAMREIESLGLRQHVVAAPAYGIRSLVLALHVGDKPQAALDMRQARLLMAQYRGYLPWLAVQCRIVLARTSVVIAHPSGARTLLREARGLMGECSDAPALEERHREVSQAVRALPSSAGAAALTTAELRVLRYLPTHLSFTEIGRELYISRNTVKTQAMSIYRKLHVASRAEAVDRARHFGLLEA